MLVRVLLVAMVILTGGWTSALPLQEAQGGNDRGHRDCKECQAGEYLSSRQICSKCPDNTYTSQANRENSCHSCFKNCIPEKHMQVAKNCSRTSDVVCRCMDGFVCSKNDSFTGQCSKCERAPVQTMQTPHATKHSPTTHQESHGLWCIQQIWVLSLVLLVILLSIFIPYYFCRRRKKDCLKKLVKQCSFGNQKGVTVPVYSQISRQDKQVHAEEEHPLTPTSTSSTSSCPTPQPPSTEQPLPTGGNLGPLHIYGAGTVFVSLLNQFGQNGGEKDEEDLHNESLNGSYPSSPLPLPTEEKNRDSYIFFPSQEQGKECHMSKEEGY